MSERAHSCVRSAGVTASGVRYFSENLRRLCADRTSISLICREMGLNRQQFERYLNGRSMPSAHNLRRICVYFGTDEPTLFADPSLFGPVPPTTAVADTLGALSLTGDPQEFAILRNYAGLYSYYFLTPSWQGQVQCGLVDFRADGDTIRTRYLARVRDLESGRLYRSRFDGNAVFRGDSIFVFEHAAQVKDSFGQTILFPAHQHQSSYLTGMTFGIAWHPHRAPLCITRHHEAHPQSRALREAVESCGIYAPTNRVLDPIVRNFFSDCATVPYLVMP